MPKGIPKNGKRNVTTNKAWFKKGSELSEETREKIRVGHLGINDWTKGKHWKLSEETKQKMREAKKGKPRVFRKGYIPWNKGKKGLQKHTEETKEKIRIARLKQKLPTTDTSIELKVKEWLEERKIEFIQQFNLGNKFQCDFYLPLLNLIVECDGTYWHSRPEMKKRDKAKDGYAKKCGFNMLRLKESEINKGRISLGEFN